MASKRAPDFNQYLMFKPESSWQIPTELPDLSQETEVAIDTETFDKNLSNSMGPGFFKFDGNFNLGFVAGISVAWREMAVYIPLRHASKNYFSRLLVGRWLADLARQSHTRFVFHNFQYDWGWLEATFNVAPPANIDDTMAMASMVDENLPSFSLDDLCAWQGLPGKDEELLKVIASLRKVVPKDLKKYMHEYEPEYVGPYAEQDARSTLALAAKLRPIIEEEGLQRAYKVEQDLLPITLKMKQRGIRVDIDRATELRDALWKRAKEELEDLSLELGQTVTIKDVRSGRWIAHIFDKLGEKYPRTGHKTEKYEEGQPSFEKVFMANHPHRVPRIIHSVKHKYDFADKFLDTFILSYKYHGRVHPTVNQFRSEGGGARSHRFSYADPPMQQMPSRDDEYAPLIRSCFLPEEGHEWCSIDYRQQEYRLIVFVAELLRARGAHKAAERYRNDPSTDFHDYVALITRLQRRRAKDVNFAKSYGAGIPKFALMTGMSQDEAKSVMEQYDEELPFVKEAAGRYNRYAAEHGYIKLIDGARNRFPFWEPMYRDFAKEEEYRLRNRQIDTWPCYLSEYNRRKEDKDHPWYGERGKRAYVHKAFNRMIQGSAARQMKKAMVDIHYETGILPLLQMHDELGLSLGKRSDALICAKLMQEALPVITIPMTTDIEIGPSWGEVEKIILK